MKTIGILGGMSWESSATYYRLINQRVRAALGGNASARLILYSFDFAEIEAMQMAGDWDGLTARMVDAARRLVGAGADLLVIATNTMHKMAAEVQAAAGVPLLHIADPAGRAARAAGFTRVGLLGTRFTMEQAFYRAALEAHGLEVLVPDEAGRATVHRIIYQELVGGVIREESRAAYRAVIADLVAQGVQAVVLGCTEIMLLVGEGDSAVPLLDTTTLHAEAAADAALGG
ncbi:MAG: aspartate/glutamate racemase family protein [Proteobacteria bacterium]|nr:aspartate/glutamate racemase family protein [Pseudomonadota bacterium]